MIDLYAILGLSRDADTRAIRKAYRQKAREAHPDVGGTREHFGMVSTALAVLGDHGRRQHYDATGQFEDVPADNGRGKALETLSQILDAIVEDSKGKGRPLTSIDLVAKIGEVIRDTRAKMQTGNAVAVARIAVYQTLVGRFRVVDVEANNPFELIIAAKIEQLERQIATTKEQAKALDDVAAMVAGASFRRDEEPTFEVTELLRKVGDGIYSPFQPSVRNCTL